MSDDLYETISDAVRDHGFPEVVQQLAVLAENEAESASEDEEHLYAELSDALEKWASRMQDGHIPVDDA